MSKQTVARVACLSTLLGLSACGGGDGDLTGICRVLAGGSSSVDSRHQVGNMMDFEKAFDGSLNTFAIYRATAGNGSATFIGRAQSGTIVPTGTLAGTVLVVPPDSSTLTVNITTTLNGVVQDSGTAGTFNRGETPACGGLCEFQGDNIYFAIQSTKPFDGITADFQVTGLPFDLQVRELCTR